MTDAEFEKAFDEMCLFMVGDIQRSIDDARANYLVALGLFSYLEVLGGLVSGQGAMRDKSNSNFSAAIARLPKADRDLDARLVVTAAGKTVGQGLYAVFRCGLVHEYSSKGEFSRTGSVVIRNRPSARPRGAHGVLQLSIGTGRPSS